MRFTVVERRGPRLPTTFPSAQLVRDTWNDRGFVTMFDLVIFTSDGIRHEVGQVKIGQQGMVVSSLNVSRSRVDVPERFDALDERFFSVGQDDTYYENVAQLKVVP
ncbi:hypothetical protein AB0I53_24295 [Saccharopolyspora sp. NPDC050389]|uniref:hypothetical protein n=1 Tax=Saccharopolyspora sp. NPDC050389 TaxID=3155516 RepID=UPI0034108F8A